MGGLSPAGLAAFAYCLMVFLPFDSGPQFTAGAALTVLFSAAGIPPLASWSAPLRRIGCRLICCAIGLQLGCVATIARDREDASLGIPAGQVTAYVVSLSEDTAVSSTGRLFSRGHLRSVDSKDGTTASARGTVLMSGGKEKYLWGAEVRVHGTIKRSRAAGTDWIATVRNSEQIECKGYFLLRGRARTWVVQRLHQLSAEDAGLFMALFLGVRDDLGDAESYFFRRAGAVHLLALSGFHLGILSLILVGMLSPFLGKNRALIVAALGLIGYLFVAGPKVSLLRAVIMFTLLGLCRKAGLRARGFDLLGLSFLANALLWPESMATLSFQLSYLALAGIMFVGSVFDGVFATVLPKLLRLPLGAAFGALTATMATLAARFGLIYPVGIASGLVLTPLVTAFVWGGLAILFLPLPAPLLAFAAQGLHLVHLVLLSCAEFFSRFAPVRIHDWKIVLLASLAILALSRLPRVLAAYGRLRVQYEERESP